MSKRKVGFLKLKGNRVALIALDQSKKAVAQLAGETLKEKYGATVMVMADADEYKDWYSLAHFEPHLTIFISSGSDRVVPATARDKVQIRKRPRGYSKMAQDKFIHELRMRGGSPYCRGIYILPWEEIKHIPWYLEDDSPMLYVQSHLPGDKLESTLVNGAYRYFIDLADLLYKKQIQDEREAECSHCKNELYGTVHR